MTLDIFSLFAFLLEAMSLMTFPENSGFVCLFFCFHFKNRVSCSSGWILTCLALQNDFELLLCVPLPPKNWDAGMHHHGGPHRMLWHLLLIWSFPDSFPYCLAFPLIFIAAIVFSSWLSYVPLSYLFILKQQFLGTNLTLFKSFFFVVGDASSSEYVFGDMMSLISCNLRSPILTVHCSTEYTEVMPPNPLQTVGIRYTNDSRFSGDHPLTSSLPCLIYDRY